MSRIRSKNTSPERKVFSYLRRHKIHFQKHYKRVPGNPDVAVPSKKKAVFIDGDFWHGRYFESDKYRLPQEYWIPKIEKNIKRDKRNRAKLRKAGWSTLRVWESDLKRKRTEERQLIRIANFLTR